jgi:hypothetical protein
MAEDALYWSKEGEGGLKLAWPGKEKTQARQSRCQRLIHDPAGWWGAVGDGLQGTRPRGASRLRRYRDSSAHCEPPTTTPILLPSTSPM